MRAHLLRITDAGRRNMLFHVPMTELYDLWAKCHKETDYALGLLAMNHFYNFGRQISPIGSTKLLSLCIRCKQYDEAIQLLKHSNAWLQEPPSLYLIYTLMNILFVRAEYHKVRLCFKYIRENWKLKVRPRLYDITIKSCLLMPKYPLQEALIIYNDSQLMDVYLPESTHFTLLNCTLTLYNNGGSDADKEFYWNTMRHIRGRLEMESLMACDKFALMPKTLDALSALDKILSQ
ncbi:conserved Plasmodium protein, unknown function [Babesia microti strain RI]|uniref:Uncharacterized protein n=1 Tax=Babesia microti (strain RI) TaxID=1133968 RepID=A0A1R4AAU6_BABMR|nr:conserved Plasmodium protein, unknown function [Babesia microti strain RI]SJK86126.1 conserved Plasmodium protein, unknown function [Babesia microti strain RI]|eukprot:XP_021338320.1 conserved Plasmodium protein, unknown function [Babesia microti strain RI]